MNFYRIFRKTIAILLDFSLPLIYCNTSELFILFIHQRTQMISLCMNCQLCLLSITADTMLWRLSGKLYCVNYHYQYPSHINYSSNLAFPQITLYLKPLFTSYMHVKLSLYMSKIGFHLLPIIHTMPHIFNSTSNHICFHRFSIKTHNS